MAKAVELSREGLLLVGGLLGLFAILGYRRGINRELLALVGIVAAILVASQMGAMARPIINRFYKLGKLAIVVALGADDLGAEYAKINSQPVLFSESNQDVLDLLIVIGLVCITYVASNVMAKGPQAFFQRMLGLFMGGLNGYLVAIYLVPKAFPKNVTVTVPSVEVQKMLGDSTTVARVLFFFVLVVIAFGLYSSSRTKRS